RRSTWPRSSASARSTPGRRPATRRCRSSTDRSGTSTGRWSRRCAHRSRCPADRPLLVISERSATVAMIESKDRATSDPEARKAVLREIEKEGVEYVLFWFTDIEGHLKSFAITPAEVEEALDDGMGFDGSSITGFNAIEESDLVAIHDASTFRLLPARDDEARVGRTICVLVVLDGVPYDGDDRVVLRGALDV